MAEEAYRVLHGEYLSDVAAAVARDADGVAASGPQADGDTPRLRKQAIHLRTAEAIVVSEGDVQEFFSDYGTCRVEWLNAFSLNVVFEDEASANRAFDSMSEQVPTVRGESQLAVAGACVGGNTVLLVDAHTSAQTTPT